MVFNLNIVDLTIVLRPARSKAQVPGFDRVSFFFFKSKRCRFSKKKKINGFATGSCQVNPPDQPSFSLPCFFFNPAQFQPRVDPPGRAGFQNYVTRVR